MKNHLQLSISKHFTTLLVLCFILSFSSLLSVPTPIAWWNFDEAYGAATALDSYAPTINGTLTPVANKPIRVPGVFDKCLKFTGSQYVDMGNVNGTKLDIYGQNPISVSAWVRPFSLATDRQILSKGYDGSITQYELKTTSSDGKVSFRCYNIGEVQSTIPLQVNVWTHVVGVFNPNPLPANTGTWKIYFNGVDVSHQISNRSPVHTVKNFYVGAVVNQNSADQFWWHGLIDEVKIWNYALTQQDINDEYLGQSIGFLNDIKLWLDPNDLNANGNTNDNPADGASVSVWNDKTSCQENATMSATLRKPLYKSGANGINGFFPCVQFTTDYSPYHYGYSDIMEILSNQSCDGSDYFSELTSVSDMYNPVSANKSLVIVFQAGNSPSQSNPVYYTNGRQTLAEFGGPVSGYNIYMINGKIVFGMWNRLERKYMLLDGSNNPIFPPGYNLASDATYLAHLEYFADGDYAQNFRAILTRYTPITGSNPPYNFTQWVSPWLKFSGLTKDGTDNGAIGGASRTAYHDYSTGETYSDHFGGKIGEVMVLNNAGQSLGDDLYSFLKIKYLVDDLTYPVPSGTPEARMGDWQVFDNDLGNGFETTDLVSSAYPNPFVTKTTFGINLPEKQFVTVELLDAMGNRVQSIYAGQLSKGMHDFTIDGTSLSSGMYLYKVTGSSFVHSGKVVLSR